MSKIVRKSRKVGRKKPNSTKKQSKVHRERQKLRRNVKIDKEVGNSQMLLKIGGKSQKLLEKF